MRWLARGEGSVPGGESWLAANEAARAAGMRFAKRRREFLLARWTAKVTLAGELGLLADGAALARIEVRNAPSGAPLAYLDGAPAPLAVSLTDRAGWAVCLAGPAAGGFGCDLELVEPRSPAFVREYFTAAEQAALAGGDRAVLANAIWSAKESAVKALRIGLSVDTRTLAVRLAAAGAAGWAPLSVRVSEGAAVELPGWWLRCGRFVLTAVGTGMAAPPVSIEDPPALATASPEHGWLP